MTPHPSNKTSAEVVADSVSPLGARLTTLEVVMHPRAVEHFLTHAMIRRNGASKRAIPMVKQIQMVRDDPCFPAKFGAEQKGMQSGDELTGEALEDAQAIWIRARDSAIQFALEFTELGVHKEVAHAPLAPFQWRKYVITATDWQGFFDQRIHPAAQADIHLLASKIKAAMDASEPRFTDFGEWHTPYVSDEDRRECFRRGIRPEQVSAGRCAAVSYLNHAADQPLERGVARFELLTSETPPHASPLEHTARPLDYGTGERYVRGPFRGWRSLRSEIGMA